MSDTRGYGSPAAFRRALTDKLRAKAETSRWTLIIERAYLPTEEEAARARATVERLEDALGAATLDGGEFVDAAMLGAARQIVAIADRYGISAA